MLVSVILPSLVRAEQPAPANRAANEFFESRIRPILAENCFSCHGPQKQKGGLRLDSAAGLKKGSDSGAVIMPGHPDESPLVRAIRYGGETKMPPKGKLSDPAIEALTTWVKMGAPWPDVSAAAEKAATAGMREVIQRHWAFQPVQRPALPAVRDIQWPKTPIDRFVLASLEGHKLAPSQPADKRTLLRRVTFDLLGLPPTPDEVAAFERDDSPDAYTKVVDRLLASPHYGERWGRHWLDVARYADTKGYVFQEERRYPFSYTYRDYVIRSWNEDLAYDRFILEQLAADRLVLGEDKRPLAAMGYLTLGRRFLNNVHDIIDDRIDVVCRGFLGLTVSCARCHDHKFDPIPSQDYYSMYGVFASSVEPNDLPLIGEAEPSREYEVYLKELKQREKNLADFVGTQYRALRERFRKQAADYLLAAQRAKRAGNLDGRAEVATRSGDIHPAMVRRWMTYLEQTRKTHHPVLAPWHEFAAIPEKDFAAQAPVLSARLAAIADPQRPINPRVAQAFAKPPNSLREVAERYRLLWQEAEQQWQELLKQAEASKTVAPTALADADGEAIRQVLYGANTPTQFTEEEAQAQRLYDRAFRNQLMALRRKIDEWRANPVAPPRAMVLQDASTPREPVVFLRGNPNNPGAAVPRQFLAAVAGERRQPFKQGSGRLELAQAIAARDNPLTARVLVNRVWLHHFGQGLVQTPSDYGLRGEPPTHPALLDYLATTFMDEGWSIKKLHRRILLSAVYQQRSDERTDGQQLDPENRLVWRMNRQRLEFEALRDALVAVAGRLDRKMGGISLELTKEPFTTRRTVYGFIERQNLPGLFRTFDFASPDTSSPKRHTTTVPQQALFLMNSPFAIEQVRHVVQRPDILTCEEPEERINRIYRVLYGRLPDTDEMDLGMAFVHAGRSETLPPPLRGRVTPHPHPPPQGGREVSAWEEYVQVLLLANEFAFVD